MAKKIGAGGGAEDKPYRRIEKPKKGAEDQENRPVKGYDKPGESFEDALKSDRQKHGGNTGVEETVEEDGPKKTEIPEKSIADLTNQHKQYLGRGHVERLSDDGYQTVKPYGAEHMKIDINTGKEVAGKAVDRYRSEQNKEKATGVKFDRRGY